MNEELYGFFNKRLMIFPDQLSLSRVAFSGKSHQLNAPINTTCLNMPMPIVIRVNILKMPTKNIKKKMYKI